jgi:hypothetical protein
MERLTKKQLYDQQYYINVIRPRTLLLREGKPDPRKKKRPKKVPSEKVKRVKIDPKFTLVFN